MKEKVSLKSTPRVVNNLLKLPTESVCRLEFLQMLHQLGVYTTVVEFNEENDQIREKEHFRHQCVVQVFESLFEGVVDRLMEVISKLRNNDFSKVTEAYSELNQLFEGVDTFLQDALSE